MLSVVNAGTILENKRQGSVMFKAICPAPLAATGGKISAFVIKNPLATPAALSTDIMRSSVKIQVAVNVQANQRPARYPDERSGRW